MATLPDLLKQMVEMQGSDLHLSIGSPPQSRVHGELSAMNHPELTRDRNQVAVVRGVDRRAEEALRGDEGAGLLVRHPRPRALPLQHVQPEGRGRRGLPPDSRRRSAPSTSSACPR